MQPEQKRSHNRHNQCGKIITLHEEREPPMAHHCLKFFADAGTKALELEVILFGMAAGIYIIRGSTTAFCVLVATLGTR